jgi:hypothetical protein
LTKIDRQLHGWANSYRFVSNRLPFLQLDGKGDEILSEYEQWFFARIVHVDKRTKRRVLGITLLHDVHLAANNMGDREEGKEIVA